MFTNRSTLIPGPKSKALLKRLRVVECPHITYSDRATPIFLARCRGTQLTDVDQNRYLDLTSFFSVCNLGHAPSFLTRVIQRQAEEATHGMGDVYPHAVKVKALEALMRLLPRPLVQAIFSSSGSEAVETALKTAFLVTAKPGVIAFEGAYHGLGYGALQVTHRTHFRKPFNQQMKAKVSFQPFLSEGARLSEIERALRQLERLLKAHPRYGAMIIELIQGRGGIRVVAARYLKGLKHLATKYGLVLIVDEIYTGFGRTGKDFAFQHYGIVPDLVCLGKGMANGFPISACAGRRELMRTWGPSRGEARHTSTFLGNPMGAALVCAVTKELKTKRYVKRVERLGRFLKIELSQLERRFPRQICAVRGKGLMWGVEFRKPALCQSVIKKMLQAGMVVLASGAKSEVLTLTPPFVIEKHALRSVVQTLSRCLRESK